MQAFTKRAYWWLGLLLVPTLALLGTSWILASSAVEDVRAVSVIAERHEVEIGALEATQSEIREGVVEIRTNQAAQSVTQERILDELRSLNGR